MSAAQDNQSDVSSQRTLSLDSDASSQRTLSLDSDRSSQRTLSLDGRDSNNDVPRRTLPVNDHAENDAEDEAEDDAEDDAQANASSGEIQQSGRVIEVIDLTQDDDEEEGEGGEEQQEVSSPKNPEIPPEGSSPFQKLPSELKEMALNSIDSNIAFHNARMVSREWEAITRDVLRPKLVIDLRRHSGDYAAFRATTMVNRRAVVELEIKAGLRASPRFPDPCPVFWEAQLNSVLSRFYDGQLRSFVCDRPISTATLELVLRKSTPSRLVVPVPERQFNPYAQVVAQTILNQTQSIRDWYNQPQTSVLLNAKLRHVTDLLYESPSSGTRFAVAPFGPELNATDRIFQNTVPGNLKRMRIAPRQGLSVGFLHGISSWFQNQGRPVLNLDELYIRECIIPTNPPQWVGFQSLRSLSLLYCRHSEVFLQSLRESLELRGSTTNLRALYFEDFSRHLGDPSHRDSMETLLESFTGLETLSFVTDHDEQLSARSITWHSATLRYLRLSRVSQDVIYRHYHSPRLQQIIQSCPLLEQLALDFPRARLGTWKRMRRNYTLTVPGPIFGRQTDFIHDFLDIIATAPSLRVLRDTATEIVVPVPLANVNAQARTRLNRLADQMNTYATEVFRYLHARGSGVQIFAVSPKFRIFDDDLQGLFPVQPLTNSARHPHYYYKRDVDNNGAVVATRLQGLDVIGDVTILERRNMD